MPADIEIAARFAPVFHQGLGENPRSDYFTNFDFDGDWRGDNNWDNAANTKFPLRAFVYYAVSETRTHFFIHYAVFHPRDYKGGEQRGVILSELLRQGAAKLGDRDPTGLMNEATLAHENDMEGALVVAAKNGADPAAARIAYVETLRHNTFVPYVVGEAAQPGFEKLRLQDGRVLLFIEPRGHGIEAFTGETGQSAGKGTLIYKYTGKAEDPAGRTSGPVGYELLPIETTIWKKARSGSRERAGTYGSAYDYSSIPIQLIDAKGAVSTKRFNVGLAGSAFLGKAGGVNMARPPWGWFDSRRRTDPLGRWFFDPATGIKRSFGLAESFPTAYVRRPFWAVK